MISALSLSLLLQISCVLEPVQETRKRLSNQCVFPWIQSCDAVLEYQSKSQTADDDDAGWNKNSLYDLPLTM